MEVVQFDNLARHDGAFLDKLLQQTRDQVGRGVVVLFFVAAVEVYDRDILPFDGLLEVIYNR